VIGDWPLFTLQPGPFEPPSRCETVTECIDDAVELIVIHAWFFWPSSSPSSR
jgi:hypothetical protein